MLKNCLSSLRGQIVTPTQVIVVDAGSTDGTLEYVASLVDIQLVRDGKPIGQAQALNRVFKNVTTRYTCWLSDDNVAQPGALDSAVEILERNTSIGMVSLKVKDVKGPYVDAPYVGGIWSSGILTCNQGVIRTDLLRDVGYFDEEFRDYGIDADLTAKVLVAGHQVVFTKNVAIHHHRDHAAAPGAIENDQRAVRLKAAQERYDRKYATLIQHGLADRISRKSREALWRGMHLIHGKGRRQEILGYHARDWYNVLHGRYISDLDLLRNRARPFYLVQRIRH